MKKNTAPKSCPEKSHGPLFGIRVIDLTSVQMGPYSTLILADLGADIIKVESPLEDGDSTRQSVPTRSPGMGQNFLNSNRNKRSIALNLKHPEGRAALLALVRDADVLLYNMRPQAMTRLKLGYEDVAVVNPKIIYVGAVGFSQRGRYAARPAFDDLLQGMAGMPWLLQRASGAEPRYVPYAYVDRTSSLHIVIAVTSAICHRNRTGEGQRVDVPMFENVVHAVLGEHMIGESYVPAAGPVGYARTLSRHHRPHRTKDGYICTYLQNDKQWRIFFTAIGQAERFESDERFSSRKNRNLHTEAVYTFLSEIFQTRTTAEWLKLFMDNDLPVGHMNSIEDVIHDPHLEDIGFFQRIEHPTEGSLRTMNYATEFAKSPVSNRRPAPHLGEHTVEVLTEAGYDQSRIQRLLDGKVAVSPESR